MDKTMVLVGADHRGYALKASVLHWLEQDGFAPKDLGTHSTERCDALDYAKLLATEFRPGSNQAGVLICGSGQAMTMTANRYRNLRAALCDSVAMAKTAREHNDANVLVLGADFTPSHEAHGIVRMFLTAEFLGGRYAVRRDALTALGGL